MEIHLELIREQKVNWPRRWDKTFHKFSQFCKGVD